MLVVLGEAMAAENSAAMCLVLLVLLVLPQPSLTKPVRNNQRDAELLLKFKDSFENGDTALANWNNGTDPCAWTGISCNANRSVANMYLGDFGLRGSIPSPLGWELPEQLEELFLTNNNISSTIPPAWRLGPKLRVLHASNCSLAGSVTGEWLQGASDLQALQVHGNSLTGSLPGWLPPKIQNVDFSQNRFNGTIPVSFMRLQSLQLLSLADNLLEGPIPWQFSFNTSKQLYGLMLYNNALNGTLPSWPNLPFAQVVILPGNEAMSLCKVPAAPKYIRITPTDKSLSPIGPISCDIKTSGSPNAAMVGGVVAGVVGGAVLLAASGFSLWRRKNRGHEVNRQDEEKGAAIADSPSLTSITTGSEAGPIGAARQGGTSLLASDPLLASIISNLSTDCNAGPIARAPAAKQSRTGRELGVDIQAYLVPFQDLKPQRKIGVGAFARVYQAIWNSTPVAVKLLLGPHAIRESDVDVATEQVFSPSNPIIHNLTQEAKLMAALRHPNILGFLGLCITPPCLVMEFCEHGSLYSVLQSARQSPELAKKLSWSLRLKMAMDTALGMQYLHSFKPPVIHRDLKTPNLLVDRQFRVKVCDFNLSRIMGERSQSLLSSTAVGNPRWLAPEVLAGEPHSFASDIFSFGLILWELLTLRAPWESESNPWQISSAVIRGHRPAIPDLEILPGGLGCVREDLEAFVELIRRCWAGKPEERPSFPDIVSFLRDLNKPPGLSDVSPGRAGWLWQSAPSQVTPSNSPCPSSLSQEHASTRSNIKVLKSVRMAW